MLADDHGRNSGEATDQRGLDRHIDHHADRPVVVDPLDEGPQPPHPAVDVERGPVQRTAGCDILTRGRPALGRHVAAQPHATIDGEFGKGGHGIVRSGGNRREAGHVPAAVMVDVVADPRCHVGTVSNR